MKLIYFILTLLSGMLFLLMLFSVKQFIFDAIPTRENRAKYFIFVCLFSGLISVFILVFNTEFIHKIAKFSIFPILLSIFSFSFALNFSRQQKELFSTIFRNRFEESSRHSWSLWHYLSILILPLSFSFSILFFIFAIQNVLNSTDVQAISYEFCTIGVVFFGCLAYLSYKSSFWKISNFDWRNVENDYNLKLTNSKTALKSHSSNQSLVHLRSLVSQLKAENEELRKEIERLNSEVTKLQGEEEKKE
eukprot:c8055_g1_i1.p1 GENE.c8055_g1_i1~~c8055_g1_i1.p1  ORF type:complete len:248 (-),score=93.21 c8055_g1_i1:547-1290(-)